MQFSATQEDYSSFFYENYFLARQPIFDTYANTWGYELLYRAGADANRAEFGNQSEQDFAALSVATSGFGISQDSTCRTKKLFLNFTEKLLLEDGPRALPPAGCVIEILENVTPTPAVKDKILGLKQDGYLIAVDDYGNNPRQRELLEFADIIKVDVLNRDADWIGRTFDSIRFCNAMKLAEKVEDEKSFRLLKDLGFDFFQGFFFARPENLSGREVAASQASRIRILQALNEKEIDPDKLVQLISGDPTITYRLLRFLNSPGFGFSVQISTVRHAASLLGAKRLKYWLQMVVLSDMNSDEKSSELYTMALTRARVLEELAQKGQTGNANPEAMFLFGMLSLIDVMFDMPMERVIEKLPLSEEMRDGYMNQDSTYGNYLALVKALENPCPEKIKELCGKAGVDPSVLAETSVSAIIWSQNLAEYLL